MCQRGPGSEWCAYCDLVRFDSTAASRGGSRRHPLIHIMCICRRTCRADAPPYASTAQPARAVARRRRDYLPPYIAWPVPLLAMRTYVLHTNSPWPRPAPTARVSTYTVPRPLEPPAAGVVMALCSRRPARRTVRSDMHRLDILSIGPGAGESATERMVGAGAAVPT
jgi:hypothetical protein